MHFFTTSLPWSLQENGQTYVNLCGGDTGSLQNGNTENLTCLLQGGEWWERRACSSTTVFTLPCSRVPVPFCMSQFQHVFEKDHIWRTHFGEETKETLTREINQINVSIYSCPEFIRTNIRKYSYHKTIWTNVRIYSYKKWYEWWINIQMIWTHIWCTNIFA